MKIFSILSLTILVSSLVWGQGSPYTDSQIQNYLTTNDPPLASANISTEMIDTARARRPDIMGSLDFIITFDNQINWLQVYSPSDPPDYNKAWSVGTGVLNGLINVSSFYNLAPVTISILDGINQVLPVLTYASWLNNNQDLIAVNNQIKFYIYYRNDGVSDPFNDPTVPRTDAGYLLPAQGLSYGGIYEPADKATYNIQRISIIAQASFDYFQQRNTDYYRNRAKILSQVNGLIEPMLSVVQTYASGSLNDALVFDDYGVYVNNKGNYTIKNLVVVHHQIWPLPDLTSTPFDLAPGGQSIIQLTSPFANNIDEMDFTIFGSQVQLNFQQRLVPFVASLGVFNNPVNADTFYAPLTCPPKSDPM